MKFKWTIDFRKFRKHSERGDSGGYECMDSKKHANISINRNEDTLEQVLTLYHEVTHAIFDLLTKYDVDGSQKKVAKRKTEFRDNIYKSYKDEEKTCLAIEKAVKRVLKKRLPPEFFQSDKFDK